MRINLSGRYFFPPLFDGEKGARRYFAVRVEGGSSNHSTTAGSSDSIMEVYFFLNGWTEIRIGNWSNGPAVVGGVTMPILNNFTDSSGNGHTFTGNIQKGNSYTFLRNFTYDTIEYNTVYEKGLIQNKSNASDRYPLAGETPLASWPPTGWTDLASISTGSSGDALVNNINFSTAKSSISYSSYSSATGRMAFGNSYVNVENLHFDSRFIFGFSSFARTNYFPSVTHPNVDKIMIDSRWDRSVARLGWKVGEK